MPESATHSTKKSDGPELPQVAATSRPACDWPRLAWSTLPWFALFAVVVVLVAGFEADAISDVWPRLATRSGVLDERDISGLIWLICVLCSAGLGVWARRATGARTTPSDPRRARLVRRWTCAALLLATLVSGFCYLYARRGLAKEIYPHSWDSFHYLLGAKYYDEIDYPDLYACALEALPSGRIKKLRVRDLRTNERRSAAKILAETNCRDQFSDARWKEFLRAVQSYAKIGGWKHVGRIMGDRGYNATPTHSAIAGTIAGAAEVTPISVTNWTLLDVGLVCALVGFSVWTLGLPMGLLFSLFVFINAADRMMIVGQSYFRYAWFVTLGAGALCLGKNHWVAGGVLLATSAMLNVFPVMFCVGAAIPVVWQAFETRSLTRELRRFAGAGILTTALCFAVGATTSRGLGAYTSFIQNMAVHDVAGRFPGFGVGLKFMFIHSGGPDPDASRASTRTKLDQFAPFRSVYAALAVGLVGLTAWVSRRMQAMQASVLFGLTACFCLLGTTGYYFAMASFLTLLWFDRCDRPQARWMLAGLFALNAVPLWGQAQGYHRHFIFNTLVTWTLGLYLLACLVYFARETGLWPRTKPAKGELAG